MTDSKTPDMDVAKAIERAIERLQNLHDYAGSPTWERVIREELDAVSSQALLSAYERGRADAVEAVPDEIDLYQMLKRAGHRRRADVAKFVSLTIRQLLEVKG